MLRIERRSAGALFAILVVYNAAVGEFHRDDRAQFLVGRVMLHARPDVGDLHVAKGEPVQQVIRLSSANRRAQTVRAGTAVSGFFVWSPSAGGAPPRLDRPRSSRKSSASYAEGIEL